MTSSSIQITMFSIGSRREEKKNLIHDPRFRGQFDAKVLLKLKEHVPGFQMLRLLEFCVLPVLRLTEIIFEAQLNFR
ncbi:hypothetical protein VNO77_17814 [Canavalia gladiata]|uniref:Uncharacterized protein n=1 Tax=Canavalia gladiata TaxID=3824 RepID=A0AAN9QJ16_CANGL